MADIVPLLFAHTAYKSYPEGWLVEQKWDRMGRWLDTVSTHRVEPMDTQRDQRPRRLAATARGPRPLRLLLQRHDR